MEEHGYYVEALLAKAVIHKGRPSELQVTQTPIILNSYQGQYFLYYTVKVWL